MKNVLEVALFLLVLQYAAGVQADGDGLLDRLEHSSYVTLGSAPTVIYEFFDPTCIYCAEAWKVEIPFVQRHQLEVRYLPVALLTDESEVRAAAILQSPHPASAMQTVFQTLLAGGKGSRVDIQESPNVHERLKENLDLLADTGVDALPEVVYRLPDGRVGTIEGKVSPRQIQALTSGSSPKDR